MILYHGSNKTIEKPNIQYSRATVDFGKGFYLTPLYEQAQKWCAKFKRKGQDSVISAYEFDDNAFKKFKTHKFEGYTVEWIEFIASCRKGNDTSDFDIIMGGVANDKVFNTIELYFEELIDIDETIKRLKYEKPNYQVAIRNQQVIGECLKFERSDIL